MLKAKIHSVETCGTVDGPGIRYVIFFQGCPLKCIYCHNPDTWKINCTQSIEKSVDELIEDIKKYNSYFKFSGGRITASGGEPLMQKEFMPKLLKKGNSIGINKPLNPSGLRKIDKRPKIY